MADDSQLCSLTSMTEAFESFGSTPAHAWVDFAVSGRLVSNAPLRLAVKIVCWRRFFKTGDYLHASHLFCEIAWSLSLKFGFEWRYYTSREDQTFFFFEKSKSKCSGPYSHMEIYEFHIVIELSTKFTWQHGRGRNWWEQLYKYSKLDNRVRDHLFTGVGYSTSNIVTRVYKGQKSNYCLTNI